MDISELNRISSSDKIKRHPWELTRGRIVQFLLKKYSSTFKTIIDFGSGDNFLLHELESKKLATHYFAIDTAYSEALVHLLNIQYPGSTISRKISLSDLDKKFLPADCMLFLDVIEHCENDYDVLSKAIAGEFAADNAVVVITVPAFQSLFSKHDALLGHFRRYRRKQLTDLCRKNGLIVIASGYFFLSLLIIRYIQLFLEKIKIKKQSSSLDSWEQGKVLSKFISLLLWVDFRIGYFLNKTGIKLPGLSCYCICRKR